MELKGGDRVKKEMVQFITFPFPSSSKLKIWSVISRPSRAVTVRKFAKKRDSRAELLFRLLNPLPFLTFPSPSPS